MGVKAFDVMSFSRTKLIELEQVGYQDSIEIIYDELHKTRKSFIKIGWYLKHIDDNKMYKEEGYDNINDFSKDKFNLTQPSTNRFIKLCEEFSVNNNSPELDKKYEDYSVSQLFEMISMSPEQIEQVSSDMTIHEIREVKKPSEESIRNFYCDFIASTDYAHNRETLKEYLIENFGKRSRTGSHPGLSYICSGKGIKLNGSSEITWISLVKEINELFPVLSKNKEENDIIPGQTSLESDFAQYLPDNYATSHKSDLPESNFTEENVIDGEYTEIITANNIENHIETEEPKEIDIVKTLSGMPILKNAEQRKEWLRNYKDWGLWYSDNNIHVNYYKYDFIDGSRLIVTEYPKRFCYWNSELKDEYYYHLLEKNKQGYKETYDEQYRHSPDSETYLVDFLKKIQTKKVK